MSTPVRSSHPISFSFLNDDYQPVLDILDDAEGRDMKLEITNSSRLMMKLAGEASAVAASPEKHRFELRFRPGTLNPKAEITVAGGDGGWMISKPSQTNGVVSLYLLNKNDVDLPPGAPLSLTLQHVNADGSGGARGTRVELRYKGLQYVAGQTAEALADGQRIQHLSIVNQRGRKNIPLHFGAVGSNTILNDGGTANERILKITNTLKQGQLPLSANPPSTFILSFDVYDPQEQNDWALGTSSATQAIEVEAIHSGLTPEEMRARYNEALEASAKELSPEQSQELARLREDLKNSGMPPGLEQNIYDRRRAELSRPLTPEQSQKLTELKSDSERMGYLIDHLGVPIKEVELNIKSADWIVEKNVQGTTVEWKITPAKGKTFLDKEESIQLRLRGIVSAMRSGPTNVYLRYENIPGYWDGQLITSLEKSHLIRRDQLPGGFYKQESYVGIGTDDPKSHLDVNGVANIWSGTHYAASNGKMNPGSLTIGSCDTSYGGNTRTWEDNNVAGLLLETRKNTEIAVHNNNKRLASLMYYEGGDESGDVNRITIGRNMGNDSLKTLALNGNVGIGTDNPTEKLDVRSSGADVGMNLRVANSDATCFINLYPGKRSDLNPAIMWPTSRTLRFATVGSVNNSDATTWSEKVTITGEGKVGIGKASPEYALDVYGPSGKSPARVASPDGELVFGPMNAGYSHFMTDRPKFFFNRGLVVDTGNIASFKDGDLNLQTGDTTRLTIKNSSGNVGIGTTNPTRGKLEITGSASTRIDPGTYYLNKDSLFEWSVVNPTVQNGTVKLPVGPIIWAIEESNLSLYADNAIASTNFWAFSDERIKHIEGRSDGAADLQTLLGIEVTDFRYKDVIGKGDAPHKKAIAQQVEKVYPQAVSVQTDVVPDIYQPAQFNDGWVELATDLKEGERVRLISEQAEGVYEVLEVTKDRFRTDFKPEGDRVFVFGREVNDYRTIDYDAISMLNVSATQQLKKEKDAEVKELRAELSELRAANEALEKRLQLLESKLATTAGVVITKNGSSGNGKQ